MEEIRGKRSVRLNRHALDALLAGYDTVFVDLGTGDGRYVRHVARANATWFALGIDASRDNLRAVSRGTPSNARYIIANALALPPELGGIAARISVNFPWGSLLRALRDGHPSFAAGLTMLSRPNATLDIRLNAGALVEAGWEPEQGVIRVRQTVTDLGLIAQPPALLGHRELRTFPSTWAKKLAYGRDPRAWYLRATFAAPVVHGQRSYATAPRHRNGYTPGDERSHS